MWILPKVVLVATVICLSLIPACIFRDTASVPPMEVSLYFGVDQLVRLGDTESAVHKRSHFDIKKSAVSDSELTSLRFTDQLEFPDLGVHAYLRYNRVALLEIQEPFRGVVHGKRMELFPFATQTGQNWEEMLVRQLGTPTSEASGGRLSSNSLFYTWGDISYNAMGPNQLAIYRDPDIAKYRQKNFGRMLKLFSP